MSLPFSPTKFRKTQILRRPVGISIPQNSQNSGTSSTYPPYLFIDSLCSDQTRRHRDNGERG